MNLRERFLEIMNFNTRVRSIKWEFGYWGEVIDRWYEEGLPKHHYPRISSQISTPTSDLYTPAWNSVAKARLPKGIAIMAGGLYWPTQGFPVDHDVRSHFNMDFPQVLIDVNLLFHPMFEVEMLEDSEKYFVTRDVDGVQRRFIKATQTMPSGEKYPISDRASWEKIKEERLNLNDIQGRFPANWPQLVEWYRNRDFPLAIGGYPHGFFGTLANLMGYDQLFYAYIDDPDMIHDIMHTFTELWIAVYSEVFTYVKPDLVQIWEDISYGSGPMISPAMIREFMLPYYKRFTSFLRSEGVNIIFVDTDGYCHDIIPIFIEGGATGIYPFETHTGMDIVRVRKDFPQLQMMGGIPKSDIGKGPAAIEKFLEPVNAVLKTGGYIPYGDHFIPPEVSWEGFKYYRNRLNEIIDQNGET
jgi:uroporphyrinogen decarboxylase